MAAQRMYAFSFNAPSLTHTLQKRDDSCWDVCSESEMWLFSVSDILLHVVNSGSSLNRFVP